MIYTDAIQYLYALRLFGAKFGLENTQRLAALAGEPQASLRFIHVAGTNGKGSTCAMLESIYRASGLRVGLFTSPHLVSFAERLQVNRQPIAQAEVVRLVGQMQGLLQAFPADAPPTFFEVVTVMALRWFAQQRCDLVIWETGLGGRLDATNIVTPLASVITNIGLDHQQWLGDTVARIAAEKAGIVKPGVPVVTAARPGQGLEVIAAMARQRSAPLTLVEDSAATRPPLDALDLPLHGPHQRLNAATALATVGVLAEPLPVSPQAVRAGLLSVFWPGRMQRVPGANGQIFILDGAHNPGGAEALRVALQAEFPGARPTVIFGVFRDKDSTSMCQSLAPLAGRLILTPVHSDRTEAPARLVDTCRTAHPGVPIALCASLAEALARAAGEPLVVIAGSLYLVGEAMELLHLATAPPSDEKGLNDWSVKP
jgi:dihydrofolate synthase/folylpolyglutamate synthase